MTSGTETTPTTAAQPATVPAAVEVAPTTTAATTTIRPSLRQADVTELPADLADTTLILLGAGRSATAFDLGSGELTTFEISGRSIRAVDLAATSPGGVLVSSLATGRARFFDWSFVELSALPFVSDVEVVDDVVWAVRPDPINELYRLTTDGPSQMVRTFDGPVDLVGSIEDSPGICGPATDAGPDADPSGHAPGVPRSETMTSGGAARAHWG